MHVDENEPLTEPLRAPGAGSGPEQSIMESFQRVLDALDAARAELRQTGPGLHGSGEGPVRSAGPAVRGGPVVREAPPRAGGGAREADGPGGPRTGVPTPVLVEPLWARGSSPAGHDTSRVDPPGTGRPTAPPPYPAHPARSRTSGAALPHPEDTAYPDTAYPDLAYLDLVSPDPAYPDLAYPDPAYREGVSGAVPPGGAGGPAGTARLRLIAGKRARLAGACSVGAVGGLLVASSLLANGALGTGPSAPSPQPDRPAPGADRPQEDARHPQGAVREDAGPQQRTYRIPRLRPGGESPGRYAIEVREAGARFQGPGFTA
ncbi:hypothetical protein ACIRD2_29860 [Streptomyces sp. NPDC093595]|uniref:hypothetical protein n=1 Tax=Streptomyces sp. NPDC093595 TaxID=3366045 RepID=UPI003809A460